VAAGSLTAVEDCSRFFSQHARAMRESAIRRAGDVRAPDLISFAPGFPDPALFAWDEFRDIAYSLLDGRDPTVLQYGPTRGFRGLLEALPEILAERGIAATIDNVIVTTGSQQALDLCGHVFADAGDAILVELPTYTGGITAFGNTGARLAGVRQNDEGIDLDDLDRVLTLERAAGRRIAFVYVVPNFQNPTGRLMSRSRRHALLEWASRRDVLIVEDDPYGSLYFDDVASAGDSRPLKADDREERVIYLSSFSKTVAPGFRVAWIAAPAAAIARLEIAKQSADLCSGGLDQRIVAEMWRRGMLTARLPQLRAAYQRKRTVMEQALRRELPREISWPEPKGGFFLWASLPEPIDSDALLPRAITHGVVFVPGSAFFVEGSGARFARLAFSWPTVERIEMGIRRLAGVIREACGATGSGRSAASAAPAADSAATKTVP
jgi:2-aminoadipate transaminase